ncbi:MAG: hypothetical protein HN392_10715 [Anaerolineae bacterium]|mgnify:CR=1 FL=1|jgi:hypothetical protein|nr:hypothetical protein [Anaerolineae bacterium]MBT7075477.1 hypothetical protein [Anaerolineae bacterium]MBT7781548.1 hypothetical protein [Anaerolineae bacterium]
MATEFSKDFLPEWCERCDKQGIYFVDDTASPYLVVHNKCGHEALSAWCSKCQTGFALPIKSSEQPSFWTCPTCNTKYPLSDSVLKAPINLYLEEDLPEDVRARILPPKSKYAFGINTAVWIVVALVILYTIFK